MSTSTAAVSAQLWAKPQAVLSSPPGSAAGRPAMGQLLRIQTGNDPKKLELVTNDKVTLVALSINGTEDGFHVAVQFTRQGSREIFSRDFELQELGTLFLVSLLNRAGKDCPHLVAVQPSSLVAQLRTLHS